jgi:DNA-binding SARP family transcriptional activator
MEFRLLGPLEIVERDRSLALGAGKQKALLAILLLNANEVVSTDRLHDELWGESPPATAAKSIQLYVSRLRKELGEGRLVTRPPGYVLTVEPHELDAARFRRLVGEARNIEPERAARKLREALDLWRGRPLADLEYEPFAQPEIARLREARLAALEQRIDADLAAGHHAALVGELEGLVSEHPLRERLWAQLMLALYRSSRQAEALEAYRAARRSLSEELGLEPGTELKQLEQAILTHDPELDLAQAAPPPRRAPAPAVPERSVLVVPDHLGDLPRLLRIAEPLTGASPPRELVIAAVVAGAELGAATAGLAAHRDELHGRGVPARAAAFTSPAPAEDIVRLAAQDGVDLLLIDAGAAPLEGTARQVLERAPCDAAMLVGAGGSLADGPVIVPFGAAWHDWAALELGAWVSRATDKPLRLIGAAADHREDGRDASRLLADASLIVQRQAGVVAEPLLASPGRAGIMALAQGAGLLVVGLSERWLEDGLGAVRSQIVAAPPAPSLLVRRGTRTGGMTPRESATRFGWSHTVDAP